MLSNSWSLKTVRAVTRLCYSILLTFFSQLFSHYSVVKRSYNCHKMSDKKKDTKEDKVEEKDKKSEGLGLLEEVGLGQFRIANSRTFDFGAPAQS